MFVQVHRLDGWYSMWTHTLVQEVGSVYIRLDYIGVQLKLQQHKTT